MNAEDAPKPTHRHYKGGLYTWIGEALHSETEEPLTVYLSADGRMWCRPSDMFHGTLEDGRRRFEPLD